MSEPTPYSPPNAPLSGKPPALPDRDPHGSLGAGIGLFFLCLVGGGVIGAGIMYASSVLDASGGISGFTLPMAMALPWLAMVVLGVRLARKGKSRTALGILVGFGIFVAIVVLLVAACFGLMSNLNLGNMH